jgi:nucleoside-diphosphate-sugar epimerase
MIVAVTGASGFIGGATVGRLLEKGLQVRALVRATSRTDLLESSGVTVCKVDFGNVHSIAAALSGADAVIHAAGPGLVDCIRGGLPGSESVSALVSAAEMSGCSHLVYLSSVKARAPHESGGKAASVTDIYGRRKQAEEIRIRASQRITWTIVRAAAVFGPGDRKSLALFRMSSGKFVPLLGAKAHGAFSLTFIGDLCEALILASLDSSLRGRVLEVGSDHSVTWNDLMRMLAADQARFVKLPLWLLRVVGFLGSSLTRLGVEVALVGPRICDLTHYDWRVLPEFRYRPVNDSSDLQVTLQKTQEWYQREGWLA